MDLLPILAVNIDPVVELDFASDNIGRDAVTGGTESGAGHSLGRQFHPLRVEYLIDAVADA